MWVVSCGRDKKPDFRHGLLGLASQAGIQGSYFQQQAWRAAVPTRKPRLPNETGLQAAQRCLNAGTGMSTPGPIANPPHESRSLDRGPGRGPSSWIPYARHPKLRARVPRWQTLVSLALRGQRIGRISARKRVYFGGNRRLRIEILCDSRRRRHTAPAVALGRNHSLHPLDPLGLYATSSPEPPATKPRLPQPRLVDASHRAQRHAASGPGDDRHV